MAELHDALITRLKSDLKAIEDEIERLEVKLSALGRSREQLETHIGSLSHDIYQNESNERIRYGARLEELYDRRDITTRALQMAQEQEFHAASEKHVLE